MAVGTLLEMGLLVQHTEHRPAAPTWAASPEFKVLPAGSQAVRSGASFSTFPSVKWRLSDLYFRNLLCRLNRMVAMSIQKVSDVIIKC